MPPRRGVRLPLGSPAALGCCCPLGQAVRAACSRVPKSGSRGVPRCVPRARTAARAPALWPKMGCCVRGSALGWMILVPLRKLQTSNSDGLEPLFSLRGPPAHHAEHHKVKLLRRLLPLRRERTEKPSVLSLYVKDPQFRPSERQGRGIPNGETRKA